MKPRIAAIAQDPAILRRGKLLAEIIDADFSTFTAAEAFEESQNGDGISVVICHAPEGMKEQEVAAQVQVAKYVAAKATVIVICGNRISAETIAFVKKSGADSILNEHEFENTSLPEFICSMKLTAEHLPIKAAELVPGKIVTMTLYHLMPLNRKIMPMIHKDTLLSPERFEKMKAIGEFYISRDDVGTWQKYVEDNQDLSSKGLLGRCRAKYLNLTITYKKLVQLLTDQTHNASFQEGKDLSEQLNKLASDLITSLSSVGESWDVINNSSLKELTPIDRTPAVASIAGLMSLMSSIGEPQDVMVAAMLADIGMLDLPPMAMAKFRRDGAAALTEQEKEIYYRHPLISVNRVAQRRIALNDKLKSYINNTHERMDMKGFPNKPPKGPPPEAQLIRFAECVDNEAKLEFGKERRNPARIRAEVFKREFESGGFALEFMTKIKPICSES